MKLPNHPRNLITLAVVGLFLIALPAVVLAGNAKFEQAIYVGPETIIEGNFIKAGNVIDVRGTVNGDVIVVGNSVTIAGAVAGDVIAVGNTVTITGPVSGSIRVAGSAVHINSEVEHNIWAVGGTVALGDQSKVGWDVYSGGGSVEIRGPVSGNLWLGSSTVVLGSEVGKNVTAAVDAEGQIILYPSAVINGNLNYRAASSEQLILQSGAVVRGETKQEAVIARAAEHKKDFLVSYLFFKVIGLFSLLVIGIILLSLLPKKMLEVSDEMVKRPWTSVGWGTVYLVVVPIISILLFITIIGIPLGLILIPLYLIGLYVSKVFIGLTLGLLLVNNISKAKKYSGSLIWPLVIGLVIFTAISIVPMIGWAISLLLMLWALGALMQVKKETIKELR